MSDADRAYLREVARRTWLYFETWTAADDHWLPPDNVQFTPGPTIAHRTSPTNIGLGLLATLSAHDLEFIDKAAMVAAIDATLTTVEGLERWHGHLLNWYDTRTLEPLKPAYVSTVDSGNLAAALVTLSVGLATHAPDLAARASALVEAMDFRVLYVPARRLFAIGYRLADRDNAGRLDASCYDLLASEARLASFIAIAKGDVPQAHWFHLGRATTNVRGVPVLLSWSATMFEYLMPLLVMRSFPQTLLDESCRAVVRRQVDYAATRDVPWGISESAYATVDRHGTYQYRAFGVPGLGLKRGLGDALVVAPYASALAAVYAPAAVVANLRQLDALGLTSPFGFLEAIDYNQPDAETGAPDATGVVVANCMAHHQGMTLVAIGNALGDNAMVERFHADPRVRATELLLQERPPRRRLTVAPRPTDNAPPLVPSLAAPLRRFRSPHTQHPHTQFLSNGTFVTAVTTAGGGGSTCRGLAVTRARQDRTMDHDGLFVYLRDVRSEAVWSAGFQPTCREADDYSVTFLPERATIRRRDDGLTTQLDVAVSAEDDVEVRRVTLRNHGPEVREIEVTSYGEIVLATDAADRAHPAFGKLFVRTEFLPASAALLCTRRVRDAGETALWAFHALSLEGRAHSHVEWETDRARFLGRGGTVRRPQALDGRALTGTTGDVLDPIVSLRQRVRLAPGAVVRMCLATGVAGSRSHAEALAQKYHDPSAAGRTFALAITHARSGLHHLGVDADDAILYERLASRVLGVDASLAPPAAVRAANVLGQAGLWPHGISGDLPLLLVHVEDEGGVALVQQVLRAQEYWRLKGLRADLVVINDGPGGYRDDLHAALAMLLDTGPWAGWRQRPGGAFLLRADQMTLEQTGVLVAAASAQLTAGYGDLRAHLDRPTPAAAPTPPLVVELSGLAHTPDAAAEPAVREPLTLANGLGGFADGGRAYVIVLPDGRTTPMPWVNVIANPHAGTIISESGAATTWVTNSREYRLSPSAHDPVSDPAVEAIYVRDDATGAAWAPTPGPMLHAAVDGASVVRHEAGVTRFTRTTHGIAHVLDVFMHPTSPVKFSRLRLTNTTQAPRALGVFAYTEWALGPPVAQQARHVVTSVDVERRALFARNAFTPDFGAAVAFAAASLAPASFTGDRTMFLGRNGSPADPAGLRAQTLSGTVGAGLDPCAALHVSLALAPGESRVVVFVLGAGASADEAQRLVEQHATEADADAALLACARRLAGAARGGAGAHARRLLRHARQRLAPLSDREQPPVDAGRLLPAGRRLRLPRPVAGRHGADPRAARDGARAPAARGGPSVRRGRRAALVARPGRTRHPHALLRRPAVVALRGRALPAGDRRRGAARRPGAVSGSADAGRRPARRLHAAGGRAGRRLRLRALRAGDRRRDDQRRARPAADGRWRLERRHEPRRRRRRRRKRVARLLPAHRAAGLRPVVRGPGRPRPRAALPCHRQPAVGQPRPGVGRRVVPPRLLRRRVAARLGATRRMPDRLDRAVVGGALRGGAEGAGRAGDGRRAHVAHRPWLEDGGAARSAVRTFHAGTRLHQGLSARRARKRRPVHPRRRLGDPRAGQARLRRRGGRGLPHGESDQPRAHTG